LNSQHLNSDLLKSFLAHEFIHLITFNQKERINGVQEEVWLNEARAEYAPTFLGYDSKGADNNLNRRIRDFLREPSVSFIDWENKRENYGVLNLFTQYLVDHYGIRILTDSLHSSKKGVDSINYALLKNGFSKTFDDIFKDWTIAVLVNDCSLGEKYCYLNSALKNFKLIPSINLLPLTGKSRLELTQTTKKWVGNWYKFIGGWGTLKVEFIGNASINFLIPYVTQDLAGNQTLGFFRLDDYQKGEVYIPDFGKNIISLVIIPSAQDKTVKNITVSYPFFWQASTEELIGGSIPNETSGLQNIQEILDKIALLERQLASLKAELQVLLTTEKDIGSSVSCQNFSQDLYYGTSNSSAVSCLQQFLKSKGETIYPEGLVTGNYLSLTVLAVKRYQASKGIIQTGYFGPLTRAAANKEL
ncbi:peptidoglycan-binding protein, partial [Patescibacteria group bacterium]|nr:peptidoglycan-binding protein [Patescibacteria group bacterium]